MTRIACVDSLRCAACMAVLAQHTLEVVDRERFRWFLDLSPGVFGVVLFFFVSGLVIPLSVRRGERVHTFLLRRIFRIYPAYLVALGALWLLDTMEVGSLAGRMRSRSPGELVANLFLIQEYVRAPALLGVTWTLSLEFVWYAAFAVMYYLMGRRYVVLLADGYAASLLGLAGLSMVFDVRLPAGRLCMIGAATLGYVAAEVLAGRVSKARFGISAALFSSAMLVSNVISFGYYSHPTIQLKHALAGWIGATGVFVVFVASRTVRESALMRQAVLVQIGVWSYSIYLLHGLVIASLGHTYLALLLVPGLSIPAAAVCYAWVERPGIKLGRMLEPLLVARFGRVKV